ncbi:hypothetical protein H310_10460 [Aphanomyces invadans]|uniref:C3H1-type domain-containing protein n=1 Tax=Aphanomyces invadans TaxID=157072 RepID=A0A024TQ77_9STRA|nr:hypothetical protein H310_10460 [Aphanomyces invadans]ETV96290.1 hypothetical protein H310_10460 [Aphanomyces invadans]RHY32675.1 hypothetical protein DYB32_002351 [Aphanomyces invadans]|eukprot:XP_008875082.1 hypothetical protein H310_10460 [Aphanomyces invadans]
MPPKQQASKKTVQKAKEKAVEDKTFGLKNKNKSKNVQNYIKQVAHQVKGTSEREERKKLEEKKAAQAAKIAMEKQMNELFISAIIQPKVPLGVDPKTIVCEFFKQATCAKGNRCKFSHDLMVGKKATKINLYEDDRNAKQEDKIEDWDQKKLEDVINEKHGQKVATQTDIVCKYFLDAIEKSQYGWFWTCPNGGKACKYRHALPPGYVFQTKAERDAAKSKKVEEVSIEEIIEQQRAKLGAGGGTPVTEESFAKWKVEKLARKAAEEEKRRKEDAKKSGGRGILSGRALFSYDPTLFRDDDDAAEDEYEVQNEDADDESKPAFRGDGVDEAASAMDASLYLQDADEGNLDELMEDE